LQLEVRSDFSVLAASHPILAQKLQELRFRLDPPSVTSDSLSTLETDVDRRTIIKQFEDLLKSIRCLDGLGNFLRGPSKPELHSLATGGPIVVFNVSDIRSDAFLITADDISTLYLPLLTSDSLEDYAKRFFGAIKNQTLKRYRHATLEVISVLEWLWDVAVGPVLDELGFTQMPLDGVDWPRVWWVGSGLLSVLPIHASGYHNITPPKATLDRIISSYAPTVKSLSYARERTARVDKVTPKDKAILVAMPTTPAHNILPFVDTEVEEVRRLLSHASINTAVMQNPTRMEVLSELPQNTIVHFACHGYLADDPSQSSLLLEDWKTGSLTVSDLVSLNIQYAKLAYLSACHTSSTRDFRLVDESINLSSAVQLSGYPSVVGNLWNVNDSHSAEVAMHVYAWILEGDGGFDARRSAEGLHKAVRILRERTHIKLRSSIESDPLVWAPYTHVGI
jgi:CHAT domain